MSNIELEILIPQCRARNRKAFQTLYEELSPEIFSFVASRIPEREAALDTVHDVFLDLWKSLETFEYQSVAGFYRYVFTIVRRRLARVYTQSARETRLPEEYEEVDTEPLPDQSDADTLRQGLATLNDLDRTIIELRYWSGLSMREIADRTGLTETNTKVRHHRAIQSLQTTIIRYEK